MFRPVRHSESISQQPHVQLTQGISLVPVLDVSNMESAKLARMICDGIEKAGILIAQMNTVLLADDVPFHKSTAPGQVLFGIGEQTQAIPVSPIDFSSEFVSNHLETLPLLVQTELEDRYGSQGLVIYSMQSDLLEAPEFLANGAPRRLNEIGAIAAEIERRLKGVTADGELALKNDEVLAERIRAYNACSSDNMALLGEACKDAVNNGAEAGHMELILDTAFKLYEATMDDKAAHTPIADIFWDNEHIGHIGIRKDDRDMAAEFYDPELQKRLSASAPHKRHNTPSFVAQMLPGETGDDQQTVLKTIRHGLHGLGNISINTDELPLRTHDVKGVSIDDVSDSNKVFVGPVYGVIRPSMVEDNQSIHLEPFQHQQFKHDRDELAVSGNQPKTLVHFRPHGNGHGIYHSSLKDPATHLLKIPRNAIDKNSTLGGREWFSMQAAQAMGLNTPSFGLVDLNKTTRQYVASEALSDDEQDYNVEAVNFKQELFSGTIDLGEGLSDLKIMDKFEETAGQIKEPPGYVIELFTVPEPHEVGEKHFMSIDFCNLMGLDSAQRFDGSFEAVALKLKEHGTNIEKDSIELLRRFMGSHLLGDGDLHLKNISLLGEKYADETRWELSPAYDILSMAGLSGYRVESALKVNGSYQPSIDDFAHAAFKTLDIEPKTTYQLHKEMTDSCLAFITAFRGASDISEPSSFPHIPAIIQEHRATDRAVRDMVHGIEMCLVYRGDLTQEQRDILTTRVEQENPHVYKESLSLFSTDKPEYRPRSIPG